MQIHLSSEVSELAEDLVKYQNLTRYEALNLALQIEKNEILRRGLAFSPEDKTTTALEAIVIAVRNS